MEENGLVVDKNTKDILLIQKGKSYIQQYAEEHNLLDKIPNYKIKKISADSNSVIIISGPYNKKMPPTNFLNAYATTTSTYPMYSGRSSREGDPICDSYRLQMYNNGCIICVADGCGWGERPKEASNRLKDNFVHYFLEKAKNTKTLKDLGTHLITSFSYAHYAIAYDKKDVWMAGTSTGLGGLLVQIDEQDVSPWAFVFITVGDCKCFKYSLSSKKVEDLTPGNRINIVDARDPGGRLGPQSKNGNPDLRNLDIIYSPCNEGDIIIIMSDGVHDNLDPQTLGKSPKEVGLNADCWDDIDPKEGAKVKTEYMNNLITNLIIEDGKGINPTIIVKKLVRHCLKTTGKGREWMEQNPNSALENDYVKYPGKLDHTTCAAFVVGFLDSANIPEQKSLQPEIWPF